MNKILVIRSVPLDMFNKNAELICCQYNKQNNEHYYCDKNQNNFTLMVQDDIIDQIDTGRFQDCITIRPGPVNLETLDDVIKRKITNEGFQRVVIPTHHLLFKDYSNLLAVFGFLEIPEAVLWTCPDRIKVLPLSKSFYLDYQGEKHLIEKQFYKAEECFRASIQIDDNSVRGLIGLGVTFFIENKNEEALEYFIRAFSKQPVDALEWLVNLLLFLSPTGKAEAQLSDILAMMAPRKKITIGRLYFERIGHLAENTEIYLRRRQLQSGNSKSTTIFLAGIPANRALMTLVKRQLPILENPSLLQVFRSMKKSFPNATNLHFLPIHGNEYHEFNNLDACLSFTPQEEEKGKQILEDMGIPRNKRFVCIYGRDPRFLKEEIPWLDATYHDIWRNMDIETFRPAVSFLLEQGYYILRMGKVVNQSFRHESERVIDYALQFWSDFMDIYLSAKCHFFIGSTGGLATIPQIFDVPYLSINTVPIGAKPQGKNNLYIPKKPKNRFTGEYIPLYDVLKKFTDRNKDLNGLIHYQNGIEYEDNTGEDILEATREMLENINIPIEHRKKTKEQDEYYRLYPPNHWSIKNKTPIATSFIKKYPELFIKPRKTSDPMRNP